MTKFNYKNSADIIWILAFGLIGILTAKLSSIATIIGLLALGIGLFITVMTRNKYGSAHLFAAFIIGSSAFYKMAGASLPWEFDKYAAILLLLIGIFVDNKKRAIPWIIVFYFILLLPAIFLTFDYYNDFIVARKKVTFNLSGPLLILVASFYFYKLKFTMEEFTKLSRWMILGIMLMSGYILLKVGDYAAIQYTLSSSGDASGGFSGNQVSTIYGLGIVLLGIHVILKKKLFSYPWLTWALFGLFLFQGLMTFSRGGILGAFIALSVGGVIYYFSNFNQLISFIKGSFIKLLLLAIFGTGAFMYANLTTGGFLGKRYFNTDEYGTQIKEDYTTHRGDFVRADLKLMVYSDYLGVGPGVAYDERARYLGKKGAAHTEYSRLLAEHGILGLVSLVLLFLFPLFRFFKLNRHHDTKFIFTVLMGYSLMTMTHAGMRLGLVSFLFGMALVLIVSRKEKT